MPELAITLTPSTEVERIEQAEALVRGYCGWHISPSRVADTATFRAQGGSVLTLPSLRVTAVTSVISDGTTLTPDTDYTWSSAGVLTHAAEWAVGALVTVTYTHGYATVPPEVTAIVQAVAQRATDNPGSLVRKQIGPFSEQWSGSGATMGLLPEEIAALNRYRVPGIA